MAKMIIFIILSLILWMIFHYPPRTLYKSGYSNIINVHINKLIDGVSGCGSGCGSGIFSGGCVVFSGSGVVFSGDGVVFIGGGCGVAVVDFIYIGRNCL